MRKLYPSDIVTNSKPITDFKFYCVYFLIQSGRIVYVGYSTNFGSRISAHMNSEKVFDSYYLIRCETEIEALELEKYYIQSINPYFNGLHCDKSKSDSEGILTREFKSKKRTYLDLNIPEGSEFPIILRRSEIKKKYSTKKATPKVYDCLTKPLTNIDVCERFSKTIPNIEEPKQNNTELVSIDFKIPRNSYIRKNDGYYYFSLNNEVFRAKSDLEKYYIYNSVYMPVGVFGSMQSIMV